MLYFQLFEAGVQNKVKDAKTKLKKGSIEIVHIEHIHSFLDLLSL
jgi:hypothetical protein